MFVFSLGVARSLLEDRATSQIPAQSSWSSVIGQPIKTRNQRTSPFSGDISEWLEAWAHANHAALAHLWVYVNNARKQQRFPFTLVRLDLCVAVKYGGTTHLNGTSESEGNKSSAVCLRLLILNGSPQFFLLLFCLFIVLPSFVPDEAAVERRLLHAYFLSLICLCTACVSSLFFCFLFILAFYTSFLFLFFLSFIF